MPTFPLVGIILVNFNSFKHTSECVSSLLRSTYHNFIVYIIDNGSSQSEVKKLTHLSAKERKVLLNFNGENLGFTKANNIGMRLALLKGADYLWILNNDTVVAENAIEKFLNVCKNKNLSKSETILSSTILYDQSDKVWCNGMYDLPLCNFPKSKDKNKHYHKITKDQLIKTQYSVGCSMFFSKELIKKYGYMNENYFIYYDDLDFSFKKENYFIQEPLVFHKISATSGFIGKERFTPFQAFLHGKNAILFYFGKKRVPFWEKGCFLLFTIWVIMSLYVRDLKTLTEYIRGVKNGISQYQTSTSV